MKRKRMDILRFISPRFLASYLMFFAILMTLLPKEYYERNLVEPFVVHNSSLLYILMFGCTVSFSAGCWLMERVRFTNVTQRHLTIDRRIYYTTQCLSAVGNLIFINSLNKSLGINYLLLNSLSEASPNLRYSVFEVVGEGNLSWVTPVSYVGIVVGLWYISINKNSDRFGTIFYILCSSLTVFQAFLQLSKAPIISVFILIVVTYIIISAFSGKLNARKLTFTSIAVVFTVLSVFYFLQSRRYTEVAGSGVSQLLGYFPASYNRLAALVDGTLDMPAPDALYYTNIGLWTFPIIGDPFRNFTSRILDIDIPDDSFSVWFNSFSEVFNAGFNKNFIWITTYGEAFQDYGWFAIAWFFVYGIFMGYFWKLCLEKNVIGLFMYPILVLSMQWWSIASVFGRSTFIEIFIVSILYFFSLPKLPRIKMLSKSTVDA